MTGRSFFDLRYALPGYCFLLFLVLLNLDLLSRLATTSSQVQLLLGVGGLISGIPIGFLVSQPWHLWIRLWYLRKMSYVHYLQDTYNELKDNWVAAYALADWIFFQSHAGTKEYVARRWDLINTLGATLTAMLLAIPSSMLIRIEAQYAVIQTSQWLVLLLDVSLVLCLIVGLHNIEREQQTFAREIIRENVEPDIERWRSLAKRFVKSHSKDRRPGD